MGYTVYIDSHGDPQGNFTLLATRRDADQRGLAMHPVGSFLLDHNDTKLPVSQSLDETLHLSLQESYCLPVLSFDVCCSCA